ncbi:MAG TPA: hypothetical protein DCQ92_15160 [Verrucomicrobia subdivision 3 bacterium]|nr:hypothetical protein [Limisphaerales bacterium]
MKFNKWTYGLVAVGAVSLTSAVRADETTMNAVQTALSTTTISGYVSASANWQISRSGDNAQYSPAGAIPYQGGKQDGFNLDVVKLSISKPQDESPWASGYQVDLLFGPDAVGYNPSANANHVTDNNGTGYTYNNSGSDFAIKQAYIALRTPIGNGIDWKIGVFDTIIGYETFDAGSNPNYTRSWGNAVEPTEHTGVLATYKVCDMFTVSAGIANTLTAGINNRNNYHNGGNGSSYFGSKTFMGLATITAPSNCGWAAGSTLYAGMVYGFGGNSFGTQEGNQVNYYAGATLNTPWKPFTVGAAFDYVQNLGGGGDGTGTGLSSHADVTVFGLYATIKATDKLSFSARGEYAEINNKNVGSDNSIELTGTMEYDLWANVISRLEVRYDHVISGTGAGDIGYFTPNGGYVGGGSLVLNPTSVERSALGVYANLIYKF